MINIERYTQYISFETMFEHLSYVHVLFGNILWAWKLEVEKRLNMSILSVFLRNQSILWSQKGFQIGRNGPRILFMIFITVTINN